MLPRVAIKRADLSDLERRLVKCALAGTVLDLTDDGPDDPEAMSRWGPEREVRADVIRDLLLGRLTDGVLDPRGVWLVGAVVTDCIDLDNCDVKVSFRLEFCRLDRGITACQSRLHSVDLRNCAVEGGTVISGAVHLAGARIAGPLVMVGSTLKNRNGPALRADLAEISAGVMLNEGFSATGIGYAGAVRLAEARIEGQLVMSGANLTNDRGPALSAHGASIKGDLYLDDGFTATGWSDNRTVRLSNARIEGRLYIDAAALPTDDQFFWGDQLWVVDGLTYDGYPRGIEIGAWLAFLRNGTTAYAAQPYQHLAQACRAAGHDADARRVLMDQRRDQIARGGLTRAERAWGRFTFWTLGYGYQPWRAGIGLLMVLAAALGLVSTVGARDNVLGSVSTTTISTMEGSPPEVRTVTVAGGCDGFSRAAIAVDTAIPLIKVPLTPACTVQPGTLGNWFTALTVLLRALAWAFAALFAAAFTSIIRKT